MPEQQPLCQQHIELLNMLDAKNNTEAMMTINGMRTRLHSALNDAAAVSMLLELIRSTLKCETQFDIMDALDALIARASTVTTEVQP